MRKHVGCKLTGYGKGCLLAGMAVHSASDTFAHQACKQVETKSSYVARMTAILRLQGGDNSVVVPNAIYEWAPIAHCKSSEELRARNKADKNHISYEWDISQNSPVRGIRYKYDILYQQLAGADSVGCVKERHLAAGFVGKMTVSHMKLKIQSKYAYQTFFNALKSVKKEGVPTPFRLIRLEDNYKELSKGKSYKTLIKEYNMEPMTSVTNVKASLKKGKINLKWKKDKNASYIRIYVGRTNNTCRSLLYPSQEDYNKSNETITKSFSCTINDFLSSSKKNKFILIKSYRGGEVNKTSYQLKFSRKIQYKNGDKSVKGKMSEQTITFPNTKKIKKNGFKCKGKVFAHWKTKKKKSYKAGDVIKVSTEKTLTLYPVFVKPKKKK